MAPPILGEPQGIESPAAARVALVNAPFAMADRPSIQCGLLKASLRRAGHEVDVHYLNLELAAEIGAEFYRVLAQLRNDLLLGDWLFAGAAFDRRDDEDAYRRACSPALAKTCKSLGVDFEHLRTLRRETFPAWIQRWAESIDWSSYDAVGFTTTFEQNTASFALARAIKERYPDVTILFGGSNVDGGMGEEYVRALPYIDYAVAGEGDVALPLLVARLIRGESPVGIPGVIGRSNDSVVAAGYAPPVLHLDNLPDPDYEEYFESLFRLGHERVLGSCGPLLLFESARGCWWGEKQHCTFCGLNNNGMRFRSKSAPAVMAQLRRLAARYKISNFEAVDNIMDHRYLDELCVPLSEAHFDYRIFYEVKANLSPAQLRTMAGAGINSIQPGIESLNSHLLVLMRKGITLLRNVRLLKWSYYYGIRAGWNILTGFPGETEDDYRAQLEVVRRLRHLPPPDGCGPIWLERFSPYFADRTFPVRNVRPLGLYRFIYPENVIDLAKVAYFFDYEMDSTLPEAFHGDLRAEVQAWREAWKQRPRPALVYQRCPDWIQVIDRRNGDPVARAFEGLEAEIYELCGETERTAGFLTRQIASESSRGTADLAEVQAALDRFCALGLMLEENGRYLSLALPANRYW